MAKELLTVHLTDEAVLNKRKCKKCGKVRSSSFTYSWMFSNFSELWVRDEKNWITPDYVRSVDDKLIGVYNCKDPILDIYKIHKE